MFVEHTCADFGMDTASNKVAKHTVISSDMPLVIVVPSLDPWRRCDHWSRANQRENDLCLQSGRWNVHVLCL